MVALSHVNGALPNIAFLGHCGAVGFPVVEAAGHIVCRTGQASAGDSNRLAVGIKSNGHITSSGHFHSVIGAGIRHIPSTIGNLELMLALSHVNSALPKITFLGHCGAVGFPVVEAAGHIVGCVRSKGSHGQNAQAQCQNCEDRDQSLHNYFLLNYCLNRVN